MFLRSISNYRGLAIIAIVAGHLYKFGFTGNEYVITILRNIITGNTASFVFISGFMFHYIYYKKYDYKTFLKNKFLNIGCPYLILSSLVIFLYYITSHGYFNSKVSQNNANMIGTIFNPTDSDFLIAIKYYISGATLTTYWYIPFALLLFATAPLHIWFVRANLTKQILSILILSILSILVHRPIGGTNPLHSLVFYTPIYLIGILVSLNRSSVNSYFKDKNYMLFSGVLLISIIQYWDGHLGNYHKTFFSYDGIDLMFVQKVFLMMFMYIFLEKYQFRLKILDLISETSFAIFFLHPWILIILNSIDRKFNFLPNEGDTNLLFYLFSIIFVVFLSMLIALSIKKIFKGSKKTRYLIGY